MKSNGMCFLSYMIVKDVNPCLIKTSQISDCLSLIIIIIIIIPLQRNFLAPICNCKFGKYHSNWMRITSKERRLPNRFYTQSIYAKTKPHIKANPLHRYLHKLIYFLQINQGSYRLRIQWSGFSTKEGDQSGNMGGQARPSTTSPHHLFHCQPFLPLSFSCGHSPITQATRPNYTKLPTTSSYSSSCCPSSSSSSLPPPLMGGLVSRLQIHIMSPITELGAFLGVLLSWWGCFFSWSLTNLYFNQSGLGLSGVLFSQRNSGTFYI